MAGFRQARSEKVVAMPRGNEAKPKEPSLSLPLPSSSPLLFCNSFSPRPECSDPCSISHQGGGCIQQGTATESAF